MKAVVFGDGTEIVSYDLLEEHLDFQSDEYGEMISTDEEIKFEEGKYNDLELTIYKEDKLSLQYEFASINIVSEKR